VTDEKTDDRRVVKLSDFKIAKRGAESDRTPIAVLFSQLAEVMNGGQISVLPKFPRRFHLTEPSPGKYLVLREKAQEIVVATTMDDVAKTVLRYAHKQMAHDEDWQRWVDKTSNDAARFWSAMAADTAIPMPPAWAWKDQPGLCFHRLPWAQGISGDTPTWDRLLANMDNAEAFIAWMGSLFVPESDRQTYVWLYGEGMNGKGSVVRFIHRVFGGACASEDANQASGRFWTAGLIGKRVVMFPDTNAAKFPASGLLKTLTGGDPVRVEIKGGATFTTELECKILFASNMRPELSSGKADMRRPIFCEMAPIAESDVDPDFETNLWAEGGAFITAAIAHYRGKYPRNGPIRSDMTKLMDWIEDLEARFEALYEAHFVSSGDEDYDWELQPTQLARWLDRHLKDSRDHAKFRNFLAQKGHKKVTRRGVGFAKRYAGVRLKHPDLYSALVDS